MSGCAVFGQKTVASSVLTGEVVTRSCEVECSEVDVGGSLASGSNYCCDSNLCNGAAKPNNQLPVVVGLLVGIAIAAHIR